MSINMQAQLKISYQDYQILQVKQICKLLSQERLITLSEHIQARIVLLGQNPANNECYNYVMGKISEAKAGVVSPG